MRAPDLYAELAKARFFAKHYAEKAAHLEAEIAGTEAKEASQPSRATAGDVVVPEARRPHAWLRCD